MSESGETTTSTDEKGFRILRNRIIECICRQISTNRDTTFHGVEMVKKCARAFLDEKGIKEYQFSGEHQYYKHVLESIYTPLVERGLMIEHENNNYTVPINSRLHNICSRELSGKSHIEWDEVSWES
jgi:hypothetical protein